MGSKYSNYRIRINYLNGDTEEVETTKEKSSSYNEMLGIYKKIKVEHRKDECIIDFIGITKTGKQNIRFSKDNTSKIKIDERLKANTEDIGSKLNELIETIKLKSVYHKNIVSCLEKKQNFWLHKLRYYKGDDEGKIKIFNELQEIGLQREYQKNQYKFADCFDTKKLLEKINESNEAIDRMKSGVQFTEEAIQNYNIMKEINYKTDKERIHYITQLKPKYDKTTIDQVNKKIIFYNYGYTTKKNRKIDSE